MNGSLENVEMMKTKKGLFECENVERAFGGYYCKYVRCLGSIIMQSFIIRQKCRGSCSVKRNIKAAHKTI